MQEMFLVVFAHCSGGHGDTFSVRGVYFHFRTAMEVALGIKNEYLRMTSINHGAYIYRLGLNKTYDARNGEQCVFAFRHRPSLDMAKTWFDESCKNQYLSAEDIRQNVFDQL